MLGSAILDAAIGLLLVFLAMSLLCSALREAIEGLLKQRALDLECGVRELLADPDGEGLARDVYDHPLIYGLYTGRYRPLHATGWTRWIRTGGRLPSYIPSDAFARALVDLDQQGRIQSPAIAGVMRALERGTGGDLDRLQGNVEAWFEACGERIGGWYRRRTQTLLFALGLGSAAFFNVNPLVIAATLYHEAELRETVVATAEAWSAAGGPPAAAGLEANVQTLAELASAGIPMGWSHPAATGAALPVQVVGWLLTALAVMCGAPFWFDLLGRFMTVRSTMKPKAGRAVAVAAALRETAPVAASSPESVWSAPAAPLPETSAAARAPATTTLPMSVPAMTAGGAAAPIAFTPREWQAGGEEGVL